MEIDEFEYNFSATEKPHVRNDTVTLHRRFARDHKVMHSCCCCRHCCPSPLPPYQHPVLVPCRSLLPSHTPPSPDLLPSQMKLAISYALSQSAKLSVYENKVVSIVLETKNLPGAGLREAEGILQHFHRRRSYFSRFVTALQREACIAILLSFSFLTWHEWMGGEGGVLQPISAEVIYFPHFSSLLIPAHSFLLPSLSAHTFPPFPSSESLAESGEVDISGHDIAKLIG